MIRPSALLVTASVSFSCIAQQMTLGWATPVVAQNQRVKLASNGDLFAFGTADNAAHLQRVSPDGAVLWTKVLEAPDLRALDMDVDGQDNVYLYMGFSTGQLDLDLGADQHLVDPGKVYAKYTSSGTFQWGFVLENLTDLSDDYGGISVDEAGNFYLCADLGEGIYDFDPTPEAEYELAVGTSTTGCAMARYHADGTLDWAHIWTWAGGSGNARDIAAMRDGSSFDLICQLDNGGPLSSQIDVDLGDGVYNVSNDGQHILRYTSALEFLGRAGTNYYQARITNDAAGKAYVLGYRLGGIGPVAAKFSLNGTSLEEVYETPLFTNGNLRLGDVEADEQGGCLGMYNNNCDFSAVRFYKMDVSGLVDFNLNLSSGTDCTMPGGKGFALSGNAFYIGTYNANYQIDFDPDDDDLNLPSGTNDGVIAKYSWCADAPFDPFEISTPGALCTGQEASFTVSAFGDASSYTWSVHPGWTITSGHGTSTISVMASAGSGQVTVMAVNDCGTSAPVGLTFTFFNPPIVDLGPDITICAGESTTLNAISSGSTYLWTPGGETTSSIAVSPEETTTYMVEVTDTGCSATDIMIVNVDPCLGVRELKRTTPHLRPVPMRSDELLYVEGPTAADLLGIFGSDGRAWPVRISAQEGALALDVRALPPGAFALRTMAGAALRFVISE
ncbi:MAG: hypothetical protein JNL43_09795 [Flavobacteriales bacterium]|nr:hypothetical protein [Flavobacteriales bacterium]